MARNVVVRPAVSEDFAALEPLWLELAQVGPGSQPAADRARSRWERSWLEADATYVAAIDRTPVGMIALAIQDTGAWTGRVLVMTVLHVTHSAQHKGVGNALLEVAAEFALASGVEAASDYARGTSIFRPCRVCSRGHSTSHPFSLTQAPLGCCPRWAHGSTSGKISGTSGIRSARNRQPLRGSFSMQVNRAVQIRLSSSSLITIW